MSYNIVTDEFRIEWDHDALYLYHECGAFRDSIGLDTILDFIQAAEEHSCPPKDADWPLFQSNWETGELVE